MQRLQPSLVVLQDVAVGQAEVRRISRVLIAVVRGRPAIDDRTGPLPQRRRAGRVVRMRMRADDAFHRAVAHLEDPLEMHLIGRAGIDHEPAPRAHHVGVRAGPGERARVRRDDPPDVGRETADAAGFRRRMRVDGLDVERGQGFLATVK